MTFSFSKISLIHSKNRSKINRCEIVPPVLRRWASIGPRHDIMLVLTGNCNLVAATTSSVTWWGDGRPPPRQLKRCLSSTRGSKRWDCEPTCFKALSGAGSAWRKRAWLYYVKIGWFCYCPKNVNCRLNLVMSRVLGPSTSLWWTLSRTLSID